MTSLSGLTVVSVGRACGFGWSARHSSHGELLSS